MWNDDSITLLLRWMKKQNLQTRVENLPSGLRFSDTEITRMTLLAWEMGDPEWGIVATLSYHFLLRVPSECLPLEAGTEEELLAQDPEGRHSAVAVVNDRLHIRLRSRRNRPQGSLLVVRLCNTAGAKAVPSPLLQLEGAGDRDKAFRPERR